MRHTSRLAAISIALVLILTGCGANVLGGGGPSIGDFSISPGTATISTNSSLQFNATSGGGPAAGVQWSVAGGDNGDPGTITQSGLYFPPSTLFHSVAVVAVTASEQKSDGRVVSVSARITVTPGFLAPIAPENVAITPGSTVQLTAVIGQVGGGSVNWTLNSGAGTALGGDFGTFSAATCKTGSSINTFCTITYTAPAALPTTGAVAFATATVGNTTNNESAQLLLNGSVNSNPLSHQALQSGAVLLGSSGGNAFDLDTDNFGNVIDCCGGTLGALLAGSDGNQYVLSTNHVLANSDQGSKNDAIIQPGLPDANCDPTQADSLGVLTYAVPLNSTSSNSDSAVATVNAGGTSAIQVDTGGNILELGTVGANGQIAAGAPAAGTGEAVSAGNIPARVVKSGRSTGLTCSTISSIATTVQLQYFLDCAETQPYTSKTFQNQILIAGSGFSETTGAPAGVFSDITGDSGSLVLDQSTAQPIGLLYASNDSSAVANPVSDVLNDLSQAALSQGGTATTFKFVGAAEHSVECLNYDAGTVTATSRLAPTLSTAEAARAQAAVQTAANIVNARTGVLGVAAGTSLDAPGRAGVVVYTDATRGAVAVPQELGGVRTLVIAVNPTSFSLATAPKTRKATPGIQLNETTLRSAIATKQKHEQRWTGDKAVFAVGVGQSYDNASEAAIVVMVQRGKTAAWMPDVIDGVRVRYQFADRFHTSHLEGFPQPKHLAGCHESKTAGATPQMTNWKMPAAQLRLP